MEQTTNKNSILDKEYSKISPRENFQKDLGLVHVEIKKLKRSSVWVYISFLVCIVIGAILLISERSFLQDFNFTYPRSLKLARSLLVIIIGVTLCQLALKTLNSHLRKIKKVKSKKEKIDIVLNKHQIQYSCDIKFGKKYHGRQDVVVEIKSSNDLLKNSKITYQI